MRSGGAGGAGGVATGGASAESGGASEGEGGAISALPVSVAGGEGESRASGGGELTDPAASEGQGGQEGEAAAQGAGATAAAAADQGSGAAEAEAETPGESGADAAEGAGPTAQAAGEGAEAAGEGAERTRADIAGDALLSLAGGSAISLTQGGVDGALSARSFLPSVTGLYASLGASLANDADLAQSFADAAPNGDKIVYLTFDDGPSSLTMQFLDVLDAKGVKATFFLIGRNVKKRHEVTKEIYDRGHLLANHSYTHQYDWLYSSESVLFEELRFWDEEVSEALGFGYHSDIFRFPGGSSYKTAVKYRNTVLSHGYRYFDWNCLNGDAQIKDKSAASLLAYMKQTFPVGKDEVIILMHDTETKKTTLDMLPAAIDYCRERGYRFETLENKTWP